MLEIRVGCCGFCLPQEKFFRKFKLVEVQKTFYKPPKEETAKKWRNLAPDSFEFTLKAWQLITHPSSSPTWRKAKLKIPVEEEKFYGLFKPTVQVFNAWKKTLAIAKILKTKVVVFQTPPSFTPSEENIKNLDDFFKKIDRNGLILGFEPRGKWVKEPDLIREVCSRNKLLHVTDLFFSMPVTKADTVYTRLHGLGKRKYYYDYTTADLKKLLEIIESIEAKRFYILFNNVQMCSSAKKFLDLLFKQ